MGTCKKMKAEVETIYYGENLFHFFTARRLRGFFSVLGTKQIFLRNVNFELIHTDHSNTFALLAECPNLKKLNITIDKSRYSVTRPINPNPNKFLTSPSIMNLRRIRGCQEVVVKVKSWRGARIVEDGAKQLEEKLEKELCLPRPEEEGPADVVMEEV